MKIVFVTAMAHMPWAGSEELWGRSAAELLRGGHDVSALVPSFHPPVAQIRNLQQAGCNVQMRNKKSATFLSRLLRKLTLRNKLLINPDLAWVKKQAANLVCISNGHYFDGLVYMEFCADRRIPFTLISHSNVESIWPDDATAERIKKVYQKARRVFFVSKGNLQLAEYQLGGYLTNAAIVRNPVNVDWHAELPWPVGDRSLRMACVARYEPAAKGQDLLFQVLAMEKWRQRNVLLSLFGSGAMEHSLKRLAKLLGVEAQVKFHGHVQDIEKIWRDHHCLVLPSRYEGLPLSIVEAMLCARVPIVTDVGGNAELLEDGVTGFIARHPSVQELDNAMERAWSSRNKLHKIGLCAQTVARSNIPENPAAVFAEGLVQLAQD